MKPVSRFIKGTLISLMVAMIFNLGISFVIPVSAPLTAKQAYAQAYNEPGGVCDPLPEYYDEDACNAASEAAKENEPEPGSFEELMAPVKPVQETPEQTADSDKLVKDVARAANWTHRLFAPLINFFSYKIGAFMGTDYVYDASMGEMLHKIWVISRNLVNITFVFILLWIALKEILYVHKESELKISLLKFVLILVAVNFSWLGTKVVLDASDVLTHVVFAIPSGISDPPTADSPCEINGPEDPIHGSCYPTAIFAPADSVTSYPFAFEDTEGKDDYCAKLKEAYGGYEGAAADAAYTADGKLNTDDAVSETNKKFQKRTSICYENLNLLKYNQNTAVIYMTYGMARIQNLVRKVGTPRIDELAVSVLLSLVIQLAYTVSLLALFIALVIRMAVLWFFVGFSPFLVLLIWFRGAEDYEFGEFRFGIKEFANWAFVPAKVGAVFAVSFIMISAGQAASTVNLMAFDKLQSGTGFVFKMQQIETLFAGIGSLQQFIWLLMSLVILWMGTFGILSKMSIISKITNVIDGYGKGLAGAVASLPYKAPIFPLGEGGKKVSVKKMLAPLDLRSRIWKYTGKEGPTSEEIRIVNENANSSRAKRAVLMAVRRHNTFTPAEARNLAKAFGLELSRFVKLDIKDQIAVLKKAGASESDAGEIVEQLAKHTKAVDVGRMPSPAQRRPGQPETPRPAAGSTPPAPKPPAPPAAPASKPPVAGQAG